MKRLALITTLLASLVPLLADWSIAHAQVTQETLDSISIPDKVETAIGTLDFFDGVPTDATIDKGKGGKYLVLPPGYTGEVPDGYFVLKPLTNRNFLFLRGSIAKGLEPAVNNITSGLKIYPLKDAAKPAPTEFVNMSGKSFNTVLPNDLGYFEILDAIIQPPATSPSRQIQTKRRSV